MYGINKVQVFSLIQIFIDFYYVIQIQIAYSKFGLNLVFLHINIWIQILPFQQSRNQKKSCRNPSHSKGYTTSLSKRDFDLS
jgi:hypothetical protein